MNPFDGKANSALWMLKLTLDSHKTANAGSWVGSQDDRSVRSSSVQERGAESILRVIPHHAMHDRPIYRSSIHGL